MGGGASAFDLIDLCLEHGAAQIVWVYHSLKWMVPTRKSKRFASNLRELAKRHMLVNPPPILDQSSMLSLTNTPSSLAAAPAGFQTRGEGDLNSTDLDRFVAKGTYIVSAPPSDRSAADEFW